MILSDLQDRKNHRKSSLVKKKGIDFASCGLFIVSSLTGKISHVSFNSQVPGIISVGPWIKCCFSTEITTIEK